MSFPYRYIYIAGEGISWHTQWVCRSSWKILLRVLVGLSWSKFESMTCNLKKTTLFFAWLFHLRFVKIWNKETRNKKHKHRNQPSNTILGISLVWWSWKPGSDICTRMCQQVCFHNLIHPNSSVFSMLNIFLFDFHILFGFVLWCYPTNAPSIAIWFEFHLITNWIQFVHQCISFNKSEFANIILCIYSINPVLNVSEWTGCNAYRIISYRTKDYI